MVTGEFVAFTALPRKGLEPRRLTGVFLFGASFAPAFFAGLAADDFFTALRDGVFFLDVAIKMMSPGGSGREGSA